MMDSEEPLLNPVPGKDPVSKAKSSYRQYILEFVLFSYVTNYTIGNIVTYQYIYSYASVKLNFDPDNFTNNGSDCNVNKSSLGYQLQQEVAALASSWQLYFALASGVPGLFLGVVYGTYSDKIGRRFLMVLSTVCVACRITAYVLAIQLNLSLDYVIIGYIVEGIGSSYCTMDLGVAAYAADVTQSGKSRSVRFIVTFSVSTLSEGIAFLSTGYTIKNLGFRNTFLVILGINVFPLLGIVFLPESRSGDHMDKMTFCQYISRSFRFYTEPSSKNPYRYVYFLCGGSLFFIVMSLTQRNGIEILYLLDSPFCWNSVLIGNFQSVALVGQTLLGLFSLIVLLRYVSEELSTVICLVFLMASFLLEAFSKTTDMMYAVKALAFPTIPAKLLQRTIVSSITDVDQQGALFASLQVIDSFCNTAGTVLCNWVYELTVRYMQGAVFLYMGGLCAISAGLILILLIKPRSRVTTDEYSVIN